MNVLENHLRMERRPLYEDIYAVVSQIPCGRVATYGQVARITGRCSARMVGYALSALNVGSDVPWQRVINARGKISPHGDGIGTVLQRQLLESEGVVFLPDGRIDLDRFGWLQ
jgi:methylated-DNA-protein-cysteine methyltransferase-like protein